MADDLNKLVQDAMPGWRVLEESKDSLDAARQDAAPADQIGKASVELKKTYRKGKPGVADDAAESRPKKSASTTKFVRIVEANPQDAGAGAKTILIDTKTGKIEAAQG